MSNAKGIDKAMEDARERDLFELAESGSNTDRDTNGDYVNPYMQSAWEGWQKGRASLRNERDMLAQAIHGVAVSFGIINRDATLTGPELLMICNELSQSR